MSNLHKMPDDLPILFPRNPFYQCPHYMPINQTHYYEGCKNAPAIFTTGAQLYMDFGFVRGPDFSTEDENDKILTSIDGYNSYLLIVDETSRYH